MTTKEDFLFLKDFKNDKSFVNKNKQKYSNLNLNQGYCSRSDIVQSYNKSNNNNNSKEFVYVSFCQNRCPWIVAIIFGKIDSKLTNLEISSNLNKSINVSSKYSNFSNLNDISENQWKPKKDYKISNSVISKNNNNSTLSLHISAYENFVIETKTVATNLDTKGKCLKGDKAQQWKNASASLSFSAQNLFEFPRQQETNRATNPEIMQFKASQRLFNCNQISMPGDIISIQVGQCGNEIGNEFWKRLCMEHCIGMDGYATAERIVEDDNVSAYFSQADDNRYIPRAVLIDLEPRVINSTLNAEFGKIFNLERVFSSGGGAGNNWASGYGAGFNKDSEYGEQILNIIQSEAEISDKIDGFTLSHSIAGGTGSGLGSWILEKLVDDLGYKQIQTFSVFPNSGSDVVVQPYNAVLTLKRLIEIPQMVTVLDNAAIEKHAMDKMHIKNPSMKDVNSIIGRIMGGLTAPKRFGAPNFVSLFNLPAQLCPVSPLHFIQCGLAPMTPVDPRYCQQTTPTHLMRLLSRSDCMTTKPFQKYSPAQTDCLISGLVLFQGEIDKMEAQASIGKTNSMNPYGCSLIPFFDIQYITSYPKAKNRSAVLALNHSTFDKTLSGILSQFDTMFRNKAYINNFEKEDYFMEKGLEAMQEARNMVDDLRKAYADPWTYCSGGRHAEGEEEE